MVLISSGMTKSLSLIAAKALAQLQTPQAIEYLKVTLQDKDRLIRWSAAETLGKIAKSIKETKLLAQ